jgi:hypothetical protein
VSIEDNVADVEAPIAFTEVSIDEVGGTNGFIGEDKLRTCFRFPRDGFGVQGGGEGSERMWKYSNTWINALFLRVNIT